MVDIGQFQQYNGLFWVASRKKCFQTAVVPRGKGAPRDEPKTGALDYPTLLSVVDNMQLFSIGGTCRFDRSQVPTYLLPVPGSSRSPPNLAVADVAIVTLLSSYRHPSTPPQVPEGCVCPTYCASCVTLL